MRDRGGVVGVSAGHGYVSGTHDSGIVSSADEVLGISVVCDMRGVGLRFTNSVGVLDVFCVWISVVWVVYVGSE